MKLRIILSGAGHPVANMALDEAILRSSAPATLRLYGWDPPGLSLGYFQPLAAFRDTPGTHVIVRRLTGGGAIYHDDELTFSLVTDSDRVPADIDASYVLVHDAVARALEAMGVHTHRVPTGGPAASPRPGSEWCYARSGPHDLTDAAGRKLLGSAQRRVGTPRARVLHHGSLVLRCPAQTPFCAAVADQAEPDAIRHELEHLIVKEIARVLKLDPVLESPSENELALAVSLETARYANLEFTAHR